MVYKRYSIFPSERSRGISVEVTDARCPIVIYMDESGNGNPDQPLIVGAVVTDADAGDIEGEIRQLYRELSARRALRGHKGFEKFRSTGFHASTDPLEVSQPFIELIQRSAGFKVHMIATRQHSYQGLTEPQVISEMYETIIADNLIRYRDQAALTVCIEENDALRPMLHNLPRFATFRALVKLGTIAKLPQIRMEMVKKGSVLSLAIADYAMLATSRWISSNFTTDPDSRAYRGYREIAPSISLLQSLEDGKLASRKMSFEGP